MKNTKKVSRRAGVRSGGSAAAGSTAARTRVTRRTQSVRQPKPTTAYELLQRVCNHILEEPKRYYQSTWFQRDKRMIEAIVGAVPACGTIACRAGWIVALHDGIQRTAALRPNTGRWPPAVATRADQILGVDSFATSALFDGGACGADADPGTMKYARLGVKGLRAFMREHEAHLKARLLKDVPKFNAGQA